MTRDHVYTSGVCREQHDEMEIGPHLRTVHPGVADDLELWPDGGMVQEPSWDELEHLDFGAE